MHVVPKRGGLTPKGVIFVAGSEISEGVARDCNKK